MQIDMVVGGSDFNILKRCSSSRGGREMLRTTRFDHLPDDILTQILIRISAEDIVDSTKFVCRKWREISGTLDFAYAHLHRSTHGLLVQNHDHLKMATFMSLAQGNQVQISDFIYISRDRFIWTGCNGLTLQPKVNKEGELMITNPMTRQHFDLPPFIFPTIHPNYSSAIAYVATRKEYKVVRTYYPADRTRVCCAILTVGVDNSWRLVNTQHLPLSASGKLDGCPLVTEGFVHWVQNYDSSNNNNHILSLNMETEIITQILSPQCNGRYTYLSAGSSLSLFIGAGRLKWEVWEMKPGTGEYCWTKLTDIDLEAHKALLNESYDSEENLPLYKPAGDEDADCVDWCLSPSGWLKYPEVITFFAFKPALISCRSLRLHVVYDVETKDVSLYKSDYCCHPHLVHTNSLVRIC